MDYETILERIKNVYQNSVNFYYTDTEKKQDSFNNPTKLGDSEKESINSSTTLSRFDMEIDGNYLLFFNEIYTSTFRKWLKNILKKLAWPILKRQVYFNSAIRQLLYGLMQKSHENSLENRKINEKITHLEKIIELLPQVVQKIEQIPQLKQKTEKINQVEQKIGTRISQVEHKMEEASAQLQEVFAQLQEVSAQLQADKNTGSRFSSVEQAKIASGLWFNDPVWVGYRENGEAYWVETTERILEKTFVIDSLANLYDTKQIEILDVGAAESLLSYELASFNYSVTAIDIRPIALFHPNLKFVKSDICQPVFPPASFDCVIALSTLEHIGLGWYGDETGDNYDIEAVKQINLLLKPDGSFILTVPYGKKAVTPVHRIYDKESLERLLQNFQVMEISYGVRKDDFTWTITENELEASVQEHNPDNYLPGAVAMLICKKSFF